MISFLSAQKWRIFPLPPLGGPSVRQLSSVPSSRLSVHRLLCSHNQPTTAGSINKKTTNLDGRGGAAEKGQLRKICAQNAHTFICQQTLE
ncbi:hypothetical protein niasHT_013355 [Heterodera trifolii]|uniref:Uncharacterized protein n=1 Tax=Heterodera trifolii TaxID=157864 RepID=A0ABD2L848_9BILA